MCQTKDQLWSGHVKTAEAWGPWLKRLACQGRLASGLVQEEEKSDAHTHAFKASFVSPFYSSVLVVVVSESKHTL